MQIQTTKIYESNLRAWLNRHNGIRRALNEGGTYSTKTWSILESLYLIAAGAKEPLLISIVSESLPHLKRGCIRDFQTILGDAWDDSAYNKTEQTYKVKLSTIEFFGADESSKIRGPRRDILYLNEANNIPWDTARGLDVRTKLFTFADWNPVSEFWAHEYWVGNPENEYIHSTYQDALNVLPPEVVKNIESNKNDSNWWNIYGLGKLGKIEGLVYPHFEQVNELPRGDYFYGLDFGYSNDPSVLTKNVIIEDRLYSQELIYQTGLTNDMISNRMNELGVRQHYDEIFADAAEPKSIEEIHRSGFNIKACPKGADSVEYGHQKVRQYKQYWTKDSTNCIKEQRNFRYIPDKDGKLTDKTTHNFSHCLIAGTLIMTNRGQVPIEQVTTSDSVLTRAGWRKVKASGMTNPSAEVSTINFSNGTSITGTPDHKIYIKDRGFVPLNTCRYGDIIVTCKKKLLYTKATNTTDTQILNNGLTEITTRVIQKGNGLTYTKKYGKIILVKLNQVIKSITKTAIRLIIKLRTSNYCLPTSIKQGITTQLSTLPRNILPKCSMPLRHGTNLQSAENGIDSMPKLLLVIDPPLKRFVANVKSHFWMLNHYHKINSVLMLVSLNGAGIQELTTKAEVVLSAKRYFMLTNIQNQNAVLNPVRARRQERQTHKCQEPEIIRVDSIIPLKNKQPVYDLTIDAVPEFFANGILVHNSMDSRRYAVIGKLLTIKNNPLHIG